MKFNALLSDCPLCMWQLCTRARTKVFICWKLTYIYICDKLMSRFWHIFWYRHHHVQPPGFMIGNRIGEKTSSQRWQVLQLGWPSLLLLPLLLAHSSLATSFVPAAPCELHTSYMCIQVLCCFSCAVKEWIQEIVDAHCTDWLIDTVSLMCGEGKFPCNSWGI